MTKGIKRHVVVDGTGLPLGIIVTKANTHDSKAAYTLIGSIGDKLHGIRVIKADMSYRGELGELLESGFGVKLKCVKSNIGSSEFVPIDGRWVVERAFAWLDRYRRLCRNYEHLISTARAMTVVAFIMILIRRP